LPSLQVFLDQDLAGMYQRPIRLLDYLGLSETETGAEPTERVARPEHDRETDLSSQSRRLSTGGCRRAARGRNADCSQSCLEQFTVFCRLDGADRRPEDSDTAIIKAPIPSQLEPTVQGRLPPESQQDAVRLVLPDHLLHEVRIRNLLIVAFARNGTVIPHGEFLIEPDFHRLGVFIGVALLKRIVTGENMDGCFQALFCA